MVWRGLSSFSPSSLGRFKGSEILSSSAGGVEGGVSFLASNAISGVPGEEIRFLARGLLSLTFGRADFLPTIACDVSGPWLVARSASLRFKRFSSLPSESEDFSESCIVESPAPASCSAEPSIADGVPEAATGVVPSEPSNDATSGICAPSTTSVPSSQSMSSTPWLICRTLTSCGGEGTGCGEGVRDRELPAPSSSVVSNCVLFFFFGDRRPERLPSDDAVVSS